MAGTGVLGPGLQRLRREFAERGGDGRLGHSVGVDQPDPRQPLQAGPAVVGVHGVAAHDDQPQALRRGPARREQAEQVVPVRGREVRDGQPQLAHPVGQLGGRPGAGAAEHQGGPRGQGREDLLQRGVEAECGQLEDTVARGEPVGVDHPLQGEDQRAVGDRHALGGAGGPRGVDQVGEVVRARRVLPRRRVDGRVDGRVGAPVGCDRPHPGEGPPVRGDHHVRPAVLDQPGQPPPRVRRVQRQERAARLEHAEQGGHQVRAALQADRDDPLRADAQAAQDARQPVTAGVEVTVGERLLVGDHRDGARGVRRPGPDQPVHGARGARPAGAGDARDDGSAGARAQAEPRRTPLTLDVATALRTPGGPEDRPPTARNREVPGPDRILTVLVDQHGVTSGAHSGTYSPCAVRCFIHRLDLVL